MLLRASESGVQGHHQVLSGVRVNIDGSEVVWRSQPRAHSSISLRDRGWLHHTSSEDGHVHSYLKYGGVAEDARDARYQRTHACAYMYVFAVTER